MDMQFALSRLEIDIAEWLQSIGFQGWEFYKHAPSPCELLEVGMALTIQAGSHFLDLEIGHITYLFAKGAFMRSRTAELETLEETALRQKLAGSTYNFTYVNILSENTDDMGASRDPDDRFVFVGF